VLRRILHNLLQDLPPIAEALPEEVVLRLNLLDLRSAFQQAHFPPSSVTMEELASARSPALRRLIFEELFFLEVGMALKRRKLRSSPGIPFETGTNVREALKRILPFHPTAAQKRVLKEIVGDLRRPVPMNRLLQGDVGSGKTIVALEAAVVAIENGCQVGFLAPTEILAEQHFLYTQRIYARSGYRVGLLKSGLKKAERQALLEELADGSIHLLIGTHAVLEADVEFRMLGLVVIDEQHRFGVMQRLNMIRKGTWPHTLVMTATPIPRTLAMTLYGDLDVSVIDELPPNRVPITTRLVPEAERASAYQFIRSQVQQGRQAYVVCPLVEESEKMDLRAAQETYAQLSQKVFAGLRVGLLHGRLKTAEKEEVMARFAANETQILVATTVIEVGVDVPNASVMMIEHAERFGLAQLHQLRGRIGRGASRSTCLLMHARKLTEEAEARLRCMMETTNGFKIAETDLEIRGPGEFFGTKQAGLPALRAANILRDRDLLELARSEALSYVEHPPSEVEFHRLLEHLKTNWQRRYGLAAVG
jgi:ATP-dependent DNA helicase RecG